MNLYSIGVAVIAGGCFGALIPMRLLLAITVLSAGFLAYLYFTASGGWAGEGYFAFSIFLGLFAPYVGAMWFVWLIKRLIFRNAATISATKN